VATSTHSPGGGRAVPEGPEPLRNPRVADVLISRWAKLDPADTRNIALDAAAGALGLTAGQRESLAQAGVKDLRGIARALQAVPALVLQNEELSRFNQEIEPDDCDESKKRLLNIVRPELTELPLDSKATGAIRQSIAKMLADACGTPVPKKKGSGAIPPARGGKTGLGRKGSKKKARSKRR
jgi:hypothetical protein